MVTGKASVPIASHCGNNPVSIYLANSMITLVGDQEVPGPIQSYPRWEIQTGSPSRAAIAGEALRSIACYCGDRPGSIDLPNAVIGGVGDVEVAGLIHCYSEWSAQTGARSRGMVTGKASVPIARHRRNDPRSIYLADAIIESVGDVEVAGRIHGHSNWCVQSGAGSRAAIAGEAFRSISRYCGDHPGGIDFPNAVIGSVGDVEVADRIHSQAEWVGQTGSSSGAIVAGKGGGPIARHRLDNRDRSACRAREHNAHDQHWNNL